MVVRRCDALILCWCCMSSRSTTFAALFDRLDRWFGLTYHRLSFVCVVICDVAAFCLTLMDTSNSQTLDSARNRYSWRTRRSRSVGQWSTWHLKLSTAKGTTHQLTGGRTACWWYVVVQFSSVPFRLADLMFHSMQMLAKPFLNLLWRTGGDHQGGHAQPGWTFMMTCFRWILGYMMLDTHTHPFNGPFLGLPRWAGTRKVTNLDFTEARDSEWQWHRLGHMHVCTSLQTDNHATLFFTGRMPFLTPNQQRQSTEGTIWC